MKGGRQRCEHKGCIRKAHSKIHAQRQSNTLGKQHLCCGLCCPMKKGQGRDQEKHA